MHAHVSTPRGEYFRSMIPREYLERDRLIVLKTLKLRKKVREEETLLLLCTHGIDI